MSFAANPIGSAAAPCGFRSFLCRFELATSLFQTPTGVYGSFPYGTDSFPHRMKSFPCGNDSLPHGNDPQQLPEESIDWSDTRFFHVELSRCHMEISHSYMGNEFSRCCFEPATIGLLTETYGFTGFRSCSTLDLCVLATDPSFFAPDPFWSRSGLR